MQILLKLLQSRKDHLNTEGKYLALLVTLTFIVGQIQFGFSSYFCTMKQVTLTPAESARVVDGTSCDAACGSFDLGIKSTQGQQLIDPNCIQTRLAEKKVVDSFAGSDKSESHFVAFVVFIQPANMTMLSDHENFAGLRFNSSPPPDIPTLNSNLRI